MLILVCGDRRWGDYRCERCPKSIWPCPSCMIRNIKLKDAIRRELVKLHLKPDTDVVMHGAAKGADRIGGEWAELLKLKVIEFPAQWQLYGRGAGPIRNKQMLDEKPDVVLAFHQDILTSKGTKHMVEISRAAGVPTHVFRE